MPTPNDNETREEWMARCIPVLINEGRNRDQAVAICSSMWDRKDEDVEIDIEDIEIED